VEDVMAVALVLAPESSSGRALRIELTNGDMPVTRCTNGAFEALRVGIPAARALPLLQALIASAPSQVVIEGSPDSTLALHIA
jgi:hypothetical protein